MVSVRETQVNINREAEVLKQSLLAEIKKLDNFPKTDMFVSSSKKVEPRWGIPVRNKFDKNFFSKGILVTWYGIYVANLVDAFKSSNQVQPEKYPDFESMREATPEEYLVYYGESYQKVRKLVFDQKEKAHT